MAEPNSRTALIELRGVVKAYQTPAGPVQALKGVDLVVEPGEFAAVIGKSGSGKSTLINMITGIDRPTSGEVLVNGVSVHTLSENQIALWRGRNLGVIFQFFQLLPTLTAIENIMLPMEICNLYTPAQRRERAAYLLDLVNLTDQTDKFPAALSGGQQQRVAIARALANDPPILVADEPTGSLDSRTSEAIFQLFETLVSSGKTILMVTHDIDLATRSTRTIIVSDGKVMNEYIKTALPYLDLDQLLDTSAKFEAQTYNPGDLILRKGERSHYFYIITAGEVEVLLDAGSGHQIPVARLHSGQYFGEMQLIQGGGATANVRAGSAGVEVLRLDETGFYYLLEESAITQHTIERVVRERNMQNWLVGERDTSFHD